MVSGATTGRRRPERGEAGRGGAEEEVLHAGGDGGKVFAVADRVVVGTAADHHDRRRPQVLRTGLVDFRRRYVRDRGHQVGAQHLAELLGASPTKTATCQGTVRL